MTDPSIKLDYALPSTRGEAKPMGMLMQVVSLLGIVVGGYIALLVVVILFAIGATYIGSRF